MYQLVILIDIYRLTEFNLKKCFYLKFIRNSSLVKYRGFHSHVFKIKSWAASRPARTATLLTGDSNTGFFL